MTIRRINRRGHEVLVIDFKYRDASGAERRYRRDSAAATVAAARLEEQALMSQLDHVQRSGVSAGEPVGPPRPAGPPTVADAVE